MSEASLAPSSGGTRRKHAPIFRPKYPPPGMTWQEAKAAGKLRTGEVWWIRYRRNHRLVRESAQTTRYEDAKKLLNERRRAVDRD